MKKAMKFKSTFLIFIFLAGGLPNAIAQVAR
jgi:hypothetical protein